MSIVDKLEKSIAALFPKSGGPKQPLELHREALEQLVAKAIAGPRGDRIFPFDRVTLQLRTSDLERQAALTALLGPANFPGDIRAELASSRVLAPEDLTSSICFVDQADDELSIRCEKSEPPAPEPIVDFVPRPFTPARLVVMAGNVSEPDFTSSKQLLNVGREESVLDPQGHLIRRNDLYFISDDTDTNSSVSREHAHLRFDAASGNWRIYDDGSRFGTHLYRAGKKIAVPPHSARGALLKQGDEIFLGEARLRFDAMAESAVGS